MLHVLNACVFLYQATNPHPPFTQPPANWTLVKENSRLEKVKRTQAALNKDTFRMVKCCTTLNDNLCLTTHWFWALLVIPTNWAPDTTLSQTKSLFWLSSPSNNILNIYLALGENILQCQFIKSFSYKGQIPITYPISYSLCIRWTAFPNFTSFTLNQGVLLILKLSHLQWNVELLLVFFCPLHDSFLRSQVLLFF